MDSINKAYRLRPTWLEVDLDRLAQNIQEIRRAIGQERKLITVVKVNAYGHGVEGVVPTMIEAGADVIAVGRMADAINLRKSGCQAPIMLFGSGLPQDIAQAVVEYNVIPTVWDVAGAKFYSEAAREPMEVYLKIDAGTHRFGVLPDKAAEVAQQIEALPNIHISHIYTTLADPLGSEELLYEQYHRFIGAWDAIKAVGLNVSAGCAASALIVTRPDMYLDVVRSGNLVYGFSLLPNPPVSLDLAPIARAARTHILQLQWVEPGESIGWLRTFTASRRTLYGALPIGWTDGLSRNCATTAQVLVRGKRCPVVGGFHGEHAVVDVTDVEGVEVGDEVTIFGQQGDDTITLSEHAKWAGISELEVVVGLGQTLPHLYFKDGLPVDNEQNAITEAGIH